MDSTALAFKMLSEGADVKLHHADFRMRFNRRWEAENHATAAILAEFRKLGFAPDFSVSVMDLRECGQRVTDIALATSMIAPQMKPGDILARGSAAHDFADAHSAEVQGRRELTYRVARAIAGRDIEMVFPVEGNTRTEFWQWLPDAIKLQTISCRTPSVVDGFWQQCSECRTCRQFIAEGIPLERHLRAGSVVEHAAGPTTPTS